MNKHGLVRPLAIAPVTVLALLLCTSIALAQGSGVAFTGPVPKAHCGPGDRPESGLQGETTWQERFSGDSKLGYNCNLKLVGEYRDLPGRERWSDRVFYNDEKRGVLPISALCRNGGPAVIRYFISVVEFLSRPQVRPMLRVMLRETDGL